MNEECCALSCEKKEGYHLKGIKTASLMVPYELVPTGAMLAGLKWDSGTVALIMKLLCRRRGTIRT